MDVHGSSNNNRLEKMNGRRLLIGVVASVRRQLKQPQLLPVPLPRRAAHRAFSFYVSRIIPYAAVLLDGTLASQTDAVKGKREL